MSDKADVQFKVYLNLEYYIMLAVVWYVILNMCALIIERIRKKCTKKNNLWPRK